MRPRLYFSKLLNGYFTNRRDYFVNREEEETSRTINWICRSLNFLNRNVPMGLEEMLITYFDLGSPIVPNLPLSKGTEQNTKK